MVVEVDEAGLEFAFTVTLTPVVASGGNRASDGEEIAESVLGVVKWVWFVGW